MLSLWKWMPPRMRLYPAQPSNPRSACSPPDLVTQLTLSMALPLVWRGAPERAAASSTCTICQAKAAYTPVWIMCNLEGAWLQRVEYASVAAGRTGLHSHLAEGLPGQGDGRRGHKARLHQAGPWRNRGAKARVVGAGEAAQHLHMRTPSLSTRHMQSIFSSGCKRYNMLQALQAGWLTVIARA